jgi:hypothetical protein
MKTISGLESLRISGNVRRSYDGSIGQVRLIYVGANLIDCLTVLRPASQPRILGAQLAVVSYSERASVRGLRGGTILNLPIRRIARLIHRTNRLQSGYVYTIDMYTLPRRLA